MTELEPAHQRALRASGIQPPFRLYDLRHTYGTRAVEAGIDVFSVAKLMRHADLSAPERYVPSCTRQLEDAQKKIERAERGWLDQSKLVRTVDAVRRLTYPDSCAAMRESEEVG
jgi:integrase